MTLVLSERVFAGGSPKVQFFSPRPGPTVSARRRGALGVWEADIDAARQLRERLRERIDLGYAQVVVDLKGVEFI
jgi:hypothetical protein